MSNGNNDCQSGLVCTPAPGLSGDAHEPQPVLPHPARSGHDAGVRAQYDHGARRERGDRRHRNPARSERGRCRGRRGSRPTRRPTSWPPLRGGPRRWRARGGRLPQTVARTRPRSDGRLTRRCLRRRSCTAPSRRCSSWSRSRFRSWPSPRSWGSSWPRSRRPRRSRTRRSRTCRGCWRWSPRWRVLGPWMGHEVAAFAAQMFTLHGGAKGDHEPVRRRAPGVSEGAAGAGARRAGDPPRRQARAHPRRRRSRLRPEGVPRDPGQRGRQGGRRRRRHDLPVLQLEGAAPRVALRAPRRAPPRVPRARAARERRARRRGCGASSSCSSGSSKASATSPRSSPSSFASRRS